MKLRETRNTSLSTDDAPERRERKDSSGSREDIKRPQRRQQTMQYLSCSRCRQSSRNDDL